MPTYDLFGNTTGLPKTTRSSIPYEIEALVPAPNVGRGQRQHVDYLSSDLRPKCAWIIDMVGQVSRCNDRRAPLFPVAVRPEPLGFGGFAGAVLHDDRSG